LSYRGAAINTISITYGSVKCVAHVFYEAREAKEATEEARGTGLFASVLAKKLLELYEAKGTGVSAS